MLTWGILILSSACCQAADNSVPSLELTASSERPFVGGQIQLALTIDLPGGAAGSAGLPRLTIPWLEADYDWTMAPASWREKLQAHFSGQPVLINDDPRPIFLRGKPSPATGGPVGTGSNRYKLTWSLAAPPIDDINQGVMRFAPVKLVFEGRTVLSRPLELRLRPVPAALRPIPRVNLGVGSYVIRSEVEPRTVDLGSEARLTLRVTGKGALRNILQPAPAQLAEALPPSDFVVSSAGESWSGDGTERRFHYQVKPRRLEIDQIPRISYTCFDPDREEWLQLAAGPVRITIRNPASAGSSQPTAVTGPVPERFRFGDVSVALLGKRDWPVSPWLLLLVAGVPPLLWLAFWFGLHRVGRSLQSAGATHAARRAIERLTGPDAPTPEGLVVIFLAFCRSRFRVTLSEPTGAELEHHLLQAGVARAVVDDAVRWWNDLAAARFSAGTTDGRTSLVEDAKSLIMALDTVGR